MADCWQSSRKNQASFLDNSTQNYIDVHGELKESSSLLMAQCIAIKEIKTEKASGSIGFAELKYQSLNTS